MDFNCFLEKFAENLVLCCRDTLIFDANIEIRGSLHLEIDNARQSIFCINETINKKGSLQHEAISKSSFIGEGIEMCTRKNTASKTSTKRKNTDMNVCSIPKKTPKVLSIQEEMLSTFMKAMPLYSNLGRTGQNVFLFNKGANIHIDAANIVKEAKNCKFNFQAITCSNTQKSANSIRCKEKAETNVKKSEDGRDLQICKSPEEDIKVEEEICKKYEDSLKPEVIQDFSLQLMALKEIIFYNAIKCFKLHCAVALDIPIFDYQGTLSDKYGELHDFAELDEESNSVNYDLKIPFARILAINNVYNIKCYNLTKIYRIINPEINNRKYIECNQTSFNIAGDYALMLPDAECLKIIVEVLSSLDLSFFIRVNHRKLLNGVLSACGVSDHQFRTIFSSIIKLDKILWKDVKKEMVDKTYLKPESADILYQFIQIKGGISEVLKMLKDDKLKHQTNAIEALEELKLLFSYCETFGITNKVVFDMSLARGLDNYTGVIFEAVITDPTHSSSEQQNSIRMGSVAEGGRFDKLVSKYNENINVSCVGFSLSIEHLVSAIQAKALMAQKKIFTKDVDVFIISCQNTSVQERLKIASTLWSAGYKTEYSYVEKLSKVKQFLYSVEEDIPLAIIIGNIEIEDDIVILRLVKTGKEKKVKKGDLLKEVRKTLDALKVLNS